MSWITKAHVYILVVWGNLGHYRSLEHHHGLVKAEAISFLTVGRNIWFIWYNLSNSYLWQFIQKQKRINNQTSTAINYIQINYIQVQLSDLTSAMQIQEKSKLPSQLESSKKGKVEVINLFSCDLNENANLSAAINLRSS